MAALLVSKGHLISKVSALSEFIECRYEIRKFKKIKQRHLKKITELKQENRELKQQALEVKKHDFNLKREVEEAKYTALAEVENASQHIDIKDADQTRVLVVPTNQCR